MSAYTSPPVEDSAAVEELTTSASVVTSPGRSVVASNHYDYEAEPSKSATFTRLLAEGLYLQLAALNRAAAKPFLRTSTVTVIDSEVVEPEPQPRPTPPKRPGVVYLDAATVQQLANETRYSGAGVEHDEPRFYMPPLSVTVRPQETFVWGPADERLRGWERVRDVREGCPTWRDPVTGTEAVSPLVQLVHWVDPLEADNERIRAEIQKRIDSGVGWRYTDAFWTECIKPNPAPIPAPVRVYAGPAQHPMSTPWSRFKSRLWHLTHPNT